MASKFFAKPIITATSFQTVADCTVSFNTRGTALMMLNEGSGVVEFSFNGTTLHGEMDSSKLSQGLSFDNITVDSIWFRIKSGSSGPITLSVYTWNTWTG